ncbi:MAG: hypothetical protein ACLFRP_00720 [Puniceicoccaceae bacterium]
MKAFSYLARIFLAPAVALGSAASAQAESEEDLSPRARDFLRRHDLTPEQAARLAAAAARRAAEEQSGESAAGEPPRAAGAARPAPTVSADRVVAPGFWPSRNQAIPLAAEIREEVTDGFPERLVLFSGNGLLFSMRALPGLSVDSETAGVSVRLTNPLVPTNRLDVFLFPPGVFLPSVTPDSMLGYVRGLEKTHGEAVDVANTDDLIPGKTFKVFGERWGNVRYTLEEDGGAEKSVSEFIVLLEGRTLVLRLEGTPEWITARSGAVRSALSTLTIR